MNGDGNGWAAGPRGGTLWGRFGAAGLLLVARRDRSVLMQHRAPWTHHGGTWALPGGARDSGESAAEAALREAREETAIDAASVRVLGEHRTAGPFPADPTRPELAGQWTYTTVLAETTTGEALDCRANEESLELRWVGIEKVASLPLLPAFARSWPCLRGELVARLGM
ncbi:NUDIX domain-containing protein [Corynebacterium mastitidis]|uniref:NTP pyrophosphohydrolase n=1 Tax=Corynebacterium mastitidis TaxID=161890 RepID=A0A2N0X6Q2_9CORY|nr:NUDIX hydrolase [Corynebacterium mastitidis]PKF68388.1 NTP pyrophosphohydrolase [Corynebacterium mastitidis]